MAVLEAIQRGSQLMDAQSETVTVSTYDETKTILILTTNIPAAEYSPANYAFTIEPDTTTTIIIASYAVNAATDPTVRWTMWEFTSGVTVEHLSTTSATSVSCAARDLSESFIIYYTRWNQPAPGDWVEEAFRRAWYSATTTISFDQRSAPASPTTCVQSIEWDGATVQTITHTATSWSTTTRTDDVTAFDLAEVFLVGTGYYTTDDDDSQAIIMGVLDNNTIQYYRNGNGSSGQFEANIFVVEPNDGTTADQIDSGTWSSAPANGSSTGDPNMAMELGATYDNTVSDVYMLGISSCAKFGMTTMPTADYDLAERWVRTVVWTDSDTATASRGAAGGSIGAWTLQVLTFNTGGAADDPQTRNFLVVGEQLRGRTRGRREAALHSHYRKWR